MEFIVGKFMHISSTFYSCTFFVMYITTILNQCTVFCQINAPAWINTLPDFWLWLAISQKLLNPSELYFQHLNVRYYRVHPVSFIEIQGWGVFYVFAPSAFIRRYTVSLDVFHTRPFFSKILGSINLWNGPLFPQPIGHWSTWHYYNVRHWPGPLVPCRITTLIYLARGIITGF